MKVELHPLLTRFRVSDSDAPVGSVSVCRYPSGENANLWTKLCVPEPLGGWNVASKPFSPLAPDAYESVKVSWFGLATLAR